jgi:succinyl-diaminopimelate desuccinylase
VKQLAPDLESRVLDLISGPELVNLTIALVAAGGKNPGGPEAAGSEAATVEVLNSFCQAAGLETRMDQVAPGRPNFTAVLPGGSAPGFLFLGHSDVVPAGEGWDHPPFEPFVRAGRLYGRGSTDMKGGLAAVATALNALQEAGVQLAGNVELQCTVDEEDLGIGIRAFTQAAAGRAYSACVVAEPTDLSIVIGCRGDSYLELAVTGRSAHSGRPADGRNAIDAAARILALIRADHERLQRDPDPLLGAGSWNTGLIRGGTGISTVADHCTLSIDRRLMPDEDAQMIMQQLLERIRSAGISADGIAVTGAVQMEMPGFRTPENHPLVTNAVSAVSQACAGGPPQGGTESMIGGWNAACDGGFIARDLAVPTIVLGPGGLNDQAHQVNESVSIAEITAAARAYALMTLRHSYS